MSSSGQVMNRWTALSRQDGVAAISPIQIGKSLQKRNVKGQRQSTTQENDENNGTEGRKVRGEGANASFIRESWSMWAVAVCTRPRRVSNVRTKGWLSASCCPFNLHPSLPSSKLTRARPSSSSRLTWRWPVAERQTTHVWFLRNRYISNDNNEFLSTSNLFQ